MTLDLILIRHAKSAWDDPAAPDHDRTLTRRGRRAAATIGRWLAAQELVPDQVLCSTATRAVETWAGIAAEVGDGPAVAYLRGLYHASPGAMLDALHSARGARVAMIGHNPDMARFAATTCLAPPSHPDFRRYPTCATTLLRFDAETWTGVGAGAGRLIDFVVPRALPG